MLGLHGGTLCWSFWTYEAVYRELFTLMAHLAQLVVQEALKYWGKAARSCLGVPSQATGGMLMDQVGCFLKRRELHSGPFVSAGPSACGQTSLGSTVTFVLWVEAGESPPSPSV